MSEESRDKNGLERKRKTKQDKTNQRQHQKTPHPKECQYHPSTQ
jgi:hypothetical protein